MKLSIVIQGPVYTQQEITRRCCVSVRNHFPDAEVILSTWKGQDINGLDVDKILLLNDPGPGRWNCKRQVYSSRNGIQESKHDVILKVRTDTLFTSNKCLEYLDAYPKRVDKYKVFNRRIVIPNMQTVDPESTVPHRLWWRVFNASDWFMLGYKDDMDWLFQIPDDATEHPKLAPEQILWVYAVYRKYPNIKVKRMVYKTPDLVAKTLLFYANNLVILDTKSMFGACAAKYIFQQDDWPQWMRHAKWLDLYKGLENLSNVVQV